MSEAECESSTVGFLVDTHVHFHSCCPIDHWLDAAAHKFGTVAGTRTESAGLRGALVYTAQSAELSFDELVEKVSRGDASHWQLQATAEDSSLRAARDDGVALVVLAGRQIVTREHLEVLSLASQPDLPDGLPTGEVLEEIWSSGGIAVLPWGFGKWTASRGRLVEALIAESSYRHELYLGDTAARLARLPRPRLLKTAEKRGIGVLPGSDPFPFPDQLRKIGGRGIRLVSPLDAGAPGLDLLTRLRARAEPIRTYGSGETPLRFLRDQVRMQLLKRRRAGR